MTGRLSIFALQKIKADLSPIVWFWSTQVFVNAKLSRNITAKFTCGSLSWVQCLLVDINRENLSHYPQHLTRDSSVQTPSLAEVFSKIHQPSKHELFLRFKCFYWFLNQRCHFRQNTFTGCLPPFTLLQQVSFKIELQTKNLGSLRKYDHNFRKGSETHIHKDIFNLFLTNRPPEYFDATFDFLIGTMQNKISTQHMNLKSLL